MEYLSSYRRVRGSTIVNYSLQRAASQPIISAGKAFSLDAKNGVSTELYTQAGLQRIFQGYLLAI
ncbi:MAG: hypothetical protein LBR49_01090 [Tannerella sp.]|nr:hypothetical protein [Tannerella sp.]